ncbi:glycosyltransferase [Thiohalorhabdus denitrificans]|uniref:glycosyltransferase n=1 Tax=Thiohalorhabdus denitrificans TaxID=381306 RepID=UPI000943860F|nr:glycosyltransferase [Thiohalorhabdus denitrificans]
MTSLDFGGVEKHIELLADEVEGSEHVHCFCAIGQGGFVSDRLEARGSPVCCLEKPERIPSLGAVLALYRLFRRLRPEVVHTHGAEANFHGLIAAWLARVRVRIGEEIGIPTHGGRAKWVFRLIYSLAHRVIGVSNAVRDWQIQSGEVPPHKAIRIYNPVRLPTTKSQVYDPEQVFRIGFVGRLEPVKNPLALVDAVARVMEWGVVAELWIIGDGSQREEVEHRIEQRGLTGSVCLWGYREDPVEYVCQCHLYVQPSLSEGFGIALVEAMACGVPVLATAVGGAPEIITHGETGWLIDDSDAGPLAEALMEIWQQRSYLSSIGVAGRLAVEGRFAPSIYVKQLDSLYRTLLANK